MSEWNFNMSEAPLSEYVETETKSKSGKKTTSRVLKKKTVMTASTCKKVIRTYWLPDENRWAGYTPDVGPIAWQPCLMHPHAEMANG